MSPETKHYLIVGGALAVGLIGAIIVYKKYEANADASQAAADQANQDALAELEASSLNDPYAVASDVAGGTSISFPSSSAQQSIAQEIQSIEQAFGLAPPSTSGSSAGSGASSSSPGSSGGSTPSGSGARSGSSGPSTPTPVPPQPQQRFFALDEEPVMHDEMGQEMIA